MAEGDIYLKASSITVQDETGVTVKVGGSPLVNRELSTQQNWWGLRPVRDLAVRPVDENGVPFHLCSSGHYRPVRGFDKDASRPSGLRAYCKQCRHEMYLRQSAEAAAMAGRTLGRYRDRQSS